MRLLISLVLLVFSISVSLAQSEQLEIAEKAYNKKDYQTAIKIYESLIKSNNKSAGLLYNLANCYNATNQISKAILNYEKALILAPGNSDIKYNLSLANEKIESPITNINNFFLSKWYLGIIHSLSASTFSILLIVLIVALLSVVYLSLFRNIYFIDKYKWVIGGLLFLLIITNYSMLIKRTRINNGSHGIVMQSSTLRSGADSRSQSLQDVDAGIKAILLDSIDNWYKLSLPDREQGWMKKEEIEIIK